MGLLAALAITAVFFAVNPVGAQSPEDGTIPGTMPETLPSALPDPSAIGDPLELQVVELKAKRDFLVYATYKGIPVNVELLGVDVSPGAHGKHPIEFYDAIGATEFSVVKQGVHRLNIVLREKHDEDDHEHDADGESEREMYKKYRNANIFEFRVAHVDDSNVAHHGAILFDRRNDRNK